MQVKRIFDIILSVLLILMLGLVIFFLWLLASLDTRSNGFFFQKRIGQFGKPFVIIKLKTVNPMTKKISSFGKFLRKSKFDEFPQIWNVIKGEMSFVGPRPDIPGYYDCLEKENRKILELKPGITSEASIKYRNEESLLTLQKDPLFYNDHVIFPDKVNMNLEYYYNHTLFGDLKIIWATVFGIGCKTRDIL